MSIHEILRRHNIGLQTLNKYLGLVGLGEVEANTKLDEHDSVLFERLLSSNNLKEYERIAKEMNKRIAALRKELMAEILLIESMGLMQRKYYYRTIRSRFLPTIINFHLPFPKEYSDEAFERLYKMYVSGRLKDYGKHRLSCLDLGPVGDIGDVEYKVYPICNRYDVDEETMIMAALKNGDGDMFGY